MEETFEEKKARLKKEIELSFAGFERDFAMKILVAFKCIRCGQIIDDMDESVQHSINKECKK